MTLLNSPYDETAVARLPTEEGTWAQLGPVRVQVSGVAARYINKGNAAVLRLVQMAMAVTEICSTDPLHARLWQAYLGMTAQQRRLLGTVPIHAVIERIEKEASKTPLTSALMRDHDGLATVALFHYSRAGMKARTNDLNARQYQHDDRVMEKSTAYHLGKFGFLPPLAVIAGWKLHDGAEDHGMSFREIEIFAGANAANDVRALTIPPDAVLQKKYPELATKRERKIRFKMDSLADYNIYNAIGKAHDNQDAMESFENEIRQGMLLVSPHAQDRDHSSSPRVYSADELMANFDQRRAFQERIAAQCAMIQFDPHKNPRALNAASMGEDFTAMFSDEVRARFETAVLNASQDYAKRSVYRPNAPFMGLAAE